MLVVACVTTTLDDDPEPYDYQSLPLAILNTDWGVIPLPNDLLNPGVQAQVVRIPEVPVPDTIPDRMAIPVMDPDAAGRARALGYPVSTDTDLTRALVAGQNRLNGFLGSFAPTLPFSKPLDLDTLVPYDGTNAADANFWLMDITDPTEPTMVPPDGYLRFFNWDGRTGMPFLLTLRLPAPGLLSPPADFVAGRTYAVVATGWTDKGLKDSEGTPVQGDGTFLVFAAPDLFPESGTTYISPEGVTWNNVVASLADARMAEGARQLTNRVLKTWEALPGVDGSWTRDQVVAAWSFTIGTNPKPKFLDVFAATFGGDGLLPTPHDWVSPDGQLQPAGAPCDPLIAFDVDSHVAIESASTKSFRLFRVDGDAYVEVPMEVAAENLENGTAKVTGTPAQALAPGKVHVAVVTHDLKKLGGLVSAVDETYFGLARAALKVADPDDGTTAYKDTPLVAEEDGTLTWQSPFLDSRLDAMIQMGQHEAIDQAALESSTATVLTVLSYIENHRKLYKPHLDWLVLGDDGIPGTPGDEVDNVVGEREDVVLLWTFTTGSCG
jgi:hypothetical protein